MKKNRILMVICLMLVVSIASIGGTIAWLTDSTEEVVNTFSPTDIDVTLVETGTNTEDGKAVKDFNLVPGLDLEKDPKVSAESDVPYYVFVQVIEENWPTAKDTVDGEETLKVRYEIADGWTLVEGTTNVYYKDMANGGELTETSVLKDDTVIVANTLTKEDMAAITDNNKPSLTFKAYAIQKADGGTDNNGNFTPAEAWAQLNP